MNYPPPSDPRVPPPPPPAMRQQPRANGFEKVAAVFGLLAAFAGLVMMGFVVWFLFGSGIL